MPKYSVNELEVLVQEGKFEKKKVKSTYAREFLSRIYDTAKVGISMASIGGLGTAGLGIALMKIMPSIGTTYTDVSETALAISLFSGLSGLMFGGMPIFYNCRERAKQYVDAGGKVIYTEKGRFFNNERFVLPANYQINPDEEIDWGSSDPLLRPDKFHGLF